MLLVYRMNYRMSRMPAGGHAGGVVPMFLQLTR
jgi:hypothetical protein